MEARKRQAQTQAKKRAATPRTKGGMAGAGARAGARAAGQAKAKAGSSVKRAMPKTTKAINTRAAQAKKIGGAAGAKAKKIGRAAVGVADRAIANKINDPMGVKRGTAAVKQAKKVTRKTGKPTSRNPR